MNTATTALALQLLISGLDQVQRIAAVIQSARNQNRDVSHDDIVALQKSDDDSRKQLQHLLDQASADAVSPAAKARSGAFDQPPLETLVVNPNTHETAAQNQEANSDVVTPESEKKLEDAEKKLETPVPPMTPVPTTKPSIHPVAPVTPTTPVTPIKK